jgi:putative ABC transport system substrate-binding protein
MGVQLQILNASTSRDIDAAFAALVRERVDALFVGPDAFFNTRRVQLATMAAHHSIPTAFAVREYVDAGGLMSYGASLTDMYRQTGVYTGRILKGAKPADLPVLQSTKLELVINAQTARMLGLEVPPTLLRRRANQAPDPDAAALAVGQSHFVYSAGVLSSAHRVRMRRKRAGPLPAAPQSRQ